MCLYLYIGSNKELPTIDWNCNKPQFYINKSINLEQNKMIKSIFNLNFIYEPGTFMGCNCGFVFGDWSEKDESEEHYKRKNDLQLLFNFLKENLQNNVLKIISIDYDTLSKDLTKLKQKDFNINLKAFNLKEFDFEENIVLNIIYK